VDGANNLWIGTTLEGFIRLNPKTGASSSYRHESLNQNSLSNDKVQCITLDESGSLWIGTSGGGISIYDPETVHFSRLLHDPNNPNTICNNWINTIFRDREGLIWIGTYNRVSVYNPSDHSFSMLSVANGLLPNNIVFCIREDSHGRIWIGTNEGMACYDKKEHRSKFITTADGISNNVICAILEDDDKQLWISTHLGISCYSLTDSTFRNYFEYDGLPGNEFRRNSACKTATGEILFGGINGAAWFIPEQIVSDKRIPEVYLTDLILFNKPVQIGEKVGSRIILEKSIEKTDTLVLSWEQKNFSIEFSTIGFSNPERISYQYMLSGFDNNWINTGAGNRRATYTNLEPGKYIFKVRATDKENFSQIRQVRVVGKSHLLCCGPHSIIWILPVPEKPDQAPPGAPSSGTSGENN
jgi:sugar lactone lactonase YvrE